MSNNKLFAVGILLMAMAACTPQGKEENKYRDASLPVEKRVISILGNLKKENIMPTKVCGTVYAQKKLTYNGNEYEIEDAMVSDMDMLWHGEVSHIPWQENIGKKLCRI